jgi:hypothetical protein
MKTGPFVGRLPLPPQQRRSAWLQMGLLDTLFGTDNNSKKGEKEEKEPEVPPFFAMPEKITTVKAAEMGKPKSNNSDNNKNDSDDDDDDDSTSSSTTTITFDKPTKKQVQALFTQWNDALTKLDSDLVTQRYAKGKNHVLCCF